MQTTLTAAVLVGLGLVVGCAPASSNDDKGGDENSQGGGGGSSGAGDSGGTGGSMAPPAPTLVDCGSASNARDPHCALGPGQAIGTGPSFAAPPAWPWIGTGFLDGGRLVLPVNLQDGNNPAGDTHGVVLAVDLATGNRTVLSGTYTEAGADKTIGSGPPLGGVHVVQPLPGGAWLAVSSDNGVPGTPRRIIQIDPETGNRSALWEIASPGWLTCSGTSSFVVPDAHVMAVDTDGTLLMPCNHNPTQAGAAIVRLDPKAKSCKVVSAVNATTAADNHGTGGPISVGEFVGLRVDSGKIWALDFLSDSLMTIDPVTGDRKVVSSGSETSPVGGGPRLGLWQIAVGPTVWTVGNEIGDDQLFGFITGVDPATGARTGGFSKGTIVGPAPSTVNNVWVYPGSSLLVVTDPRWGVFLFDPSNGNSNYLSGG